MTSDDVGNDRPAHHPHGATGERRRTERDHARPPWEDDGEAHYWRLFNRLPVGLYQLSLDGQFLDANPALVALLGYGEKDEFLAVPVPQHYNSLAVYQQWLAELQRQSPLLQYEVQWRRRDGRLIWVQNSAHQVVATDGRRIGYEGVVEDITERKRLYTQLLESQKLEALGRLAAGIAHDFNNLLAVILSSAELVEASLPADDPRLIDLRLQQQAVARGTGLTHHLLAFARQHPLTTQALDLNTVIQAAIPFLQRLIGPDVVIQTQLAPALEQVEADALQLEQVLLNLSSNARHAMPAGGTLTLETSQTELNDPAVLRALDLPAGHYVRLAVQDTGIGMDAEQRRHIFEPFFTTKAAEGGSGLGLASAYGVIRQHRGAVAVESTPHQGTTLTIYLPALPAQAPAAGEPQPARGGTLPRGDEVVLLVDDEPDVRLVTERLVRTLGYLVLSAESGAAALTLAQGWRGAPIQLLITDVLMPHMRGDELARICGTLVPGLKVLYLSGYHDLGALLPRQLPEHGKALLAKPFAHAELAHMIRNVLDEDRLPDVAPDAA